MSYAKSNTATAAKRIRLVLAAAIISLAVTLLCGCSFMRDLMKGEHVEFTRASLAMEVGEKYDISTLISSDGTSYKLSSTDTSVVSVDNATRFITAHKAGFAYIRASVGFTDSSLKVIVSEKGEDGLTITVDGELNQSVNSMSKVKFTPIGSGSAARSNVNWYVNNNLIAAKSAGIAFEYTPSAVGEYTIKAVAGEFTVTKVLRVYYEVKSTVTVSGELNQQSKPYSDVTFRVTIQDSNGQTNSVIFYDNDRQIHTQTGNDITFVYSPISGSHTIDVEVNGKFVYDCQLNIRGGAATPNAPQVVFDNLYPDVYLKYDVVGSAAVEVVQPDGSARVFNQSDASSAQMFDQNGCNIASVISLCATSSTVGTYKFRVKSLGDGDLLSAGEYSEYSVFTQLPQFAKTYINTVIPGGDLYITSDEEYVAVMEYYITFRSKRSAPSSVEFNCYIAYDRTLSAKELWDNAFPLAATAGLYTEIVVNDMGGNIMRTSCKVSTVNTPSKNSSVSLGGEYAQQMHVVLPHINYDSAKYRPIDHVYPLERSSRTTRVEYTDELYYAAQNGFRPLPATGSPAEVAYNIARDVLRKICTDEMTDMQKAHAIYDWIMWQVTYDTPATNAQDGSQYSAYYLEGVFGDGETEFNGVAYNPNAVCDGMSKAYALMCNMEGIPCVRVVGKAGNSAAAATPHAWNKVKVGGEWYIADCTWGDSTSTLDMGSGARKYERGLHNYLFLTDEQVSSSHYEPYATGSSEIRFAPRTTTKTYSIYKDITVNGTPIDCHIGSGEDQAARAKAIATAFARAVKRMNSIEIVGKSTPYDIEYQAIEIYAEGGFAIANDTISNAIKAGIKSVKPSASVKIFKYDDIIMVLIK